ncbi:Binding-protein-dependent transport system inner membrane component [Acididesulfobacillus acetoxydans]|uniref:Binding-protein-dependent transport system inner membrane component n=1 Tax=Acididesulfobacillus acetoxydans TaxID=1561005 RepID=A0A8S0W3A7_9FIRM|nr:sugar ABC transporter permease [Acididesulfobacillus acetoxydans]CAA7601478.1 Binding-protein-dependent transport system inner membrane component [Acididesulfobacillus acetoxydans]CEJ06133.1 Maltodextrin transport system permease protein MalD [Acididesulfobacillus acetoxydans]
MKGFLRDNYFERNDSTPKIILIYLALIVMTLIAVYPILNILAAALRPDNQMFSTSLAIIPKDASWANFKAAFTQIQLTRWIYNSAFISLLTTVVTLFFSTTAGYAFSRYRFLGRSGGMIVLLVTQMFPATMILLPLNILLTNLDLSDKLWTLVIPYVSTVVPFSIWLLKGYFDTIPVSIEESAYVDGCSTFRTFYTIVVPLSKPALAVASIFAFMGAWSEYIVARVLIHNESLYTLPLGLVTLQGQYNTQWGVYSAAALITVIPVMIIFVVLSKYLVSGLTLGSVKG